MGFLLENIALGVPRFALKAAMSLPGSLHRRIYGKPIVRDGLTLDPGMQAVVRAFEVTGRSITSGSLTAVRRSSRWGGYFIGGVMPSEVREEKLVITTDYGQLNARIYTPATVSETKAPAVLFFHGGGFVFGDPISHRTVTALIAKTVGAKVISVDYRMGPEFVHPAAFEDAVASFDYLVTNAEKLGIDPQTIAISGDSAGGNLTLAAGYAISQRATGVKPVFLLPFYPAIFWKVDTESRRLFGKGFMLENESLTWFAEKYLPHGVEDSDVKLNVGNIKDLSAMPPTHIITAGFDLLRDEGEYFARKLQEQGVKVSWQREPGLLHGFVNFIGVNKTSREAVVAAAQVLARGIRQSSSVNRVTDSAVA